MVNLLFSNLSPVTVSLFSRLEAALVDFRFPMVLIYLCALLLLYVERIKRHAAHGTIKTLRSLRKTRKEEENAKQSR